MLDIIIQGPLHIHGVNQISNYQKYGNVILSCWENDPIEQFDIPNNIAVIRNKVPQGNFYNVSHIMLQATTTLEGLRHGQNEFALKIRCDERYEDLSNIIEKIKHNPRKFVCNNIIYLKTENLIFHPSDHLFGSNRNLLIKTFEYIVCNCYNMSDEIKYIMKLYDLNPLGAHAFILIAFLYAIGRLDDIMNKRLNIEEIKCIMRECTDVVPFDLFGDSLWRISGQNRYSAESKFIRSIEEV